MVAHRFGGSWTDRKLNALAEYLIQYRVIFTKNPWAKKYKTIYVDAFAGTGEREVGDDSRQASLFGYDEEKRGFQAGSVKVALTLKSKFDKYIFVDSKAKHATALKELLRNQHAELAGRCDVRREDANRWLQEWCRTEDWTKQRAVVFLDPYGMDVEWVTIEALLQSVPIECCPRTHRQIVRGQGDSPQYWERMNGSSSSIARIGKPTFLEWNVGR